MLRRQFQPEKRGERSDTDDAANSLTNGALDTLGSVIRVLGHESFQLDQDVDPAAFRDKCNELARHIENGAAVPSCDIPQSPDGDRDWSQVRRFIANRRRAEKAFVAERLDGYRDVVGDLIIGLREVGERDRNTESRVKEGFTDIEAALQHGNLAGIKTAVSDAVKIVSETFEEQKSAYEAQLGQLNNRLSGLRQDLVAVREEMKRDPLTGTYNRRAFDTSIEQSLKVHYMLGQPITLVMIDLDRFKQVNDVSGHSSGDEVLRAVGECLERSFIRRGDLVARYGGDEFVVILADTTVDESLPLVERFLQRVKEIEIDGANGRIDVSCSAGLTEIHDQDDVGSVVRRADRALYEAKEAGRDVARCASPVADPEQR